ncbi:energy transducer TonB family protein [Bartonella rattaustraliani]|uniref:energy transducer TonB family protein n=1 Tax=Bartonella rattaustraliani TaxID=481139 RepID=UPI00035FF18B|nr:TonB family protein [Bartonella rattaustraliani]
MNFANTRQLISLWICAFICAFSLHIILGARFYFGSSGVSNAVLSPAVVLAFTQETPSLDIDTDLLDMRTEPEMLQPDFLEQDLETLETEDEEQPEEPQDHVEEDEFSVLKSLEEPLLKEESFSQKGEQKVLAKKLIPMPKSVVKQPNMKAIRSSISNQGGDMTAREDALLIEWLAKVQSQLEMQKKYVVGQRISRAKGTVKLEFRVHEQGSIFSSRVIVSSGHPELDRLAMMALQRIDSFPPPPRSKVNKIIRVSLIFS